ncbi:hypothetical protein AVEN_80004-1 [Araneus ventricosus]|uniref:Uncharacterized protein n=1 Tax=Araneus ventricosus TaxID=182803 RepID=A0A4Y2FPI7_ARAVE|nr:hypothetical protein AVEN_80004-1 [Araneus ventricosus]
MRDTLRYTLVLDVTAYPQKNSVREPDLCEKPSNLEEFCKKYPFYCTEILDVNESELPKLSSLTTPTKTQITEEGPSGIHSTAALVYWLRGDIPMMGYYTNYSEEVEKMSQRYLFNGSLDDPDLFWKSGGIFEVQGLPWWGPDDEGLKDKNLRAILSINGDMLFSAAHNNVYRILCVRRDVEDVWCCGAP